MNILATATSIGACASGALTGVIASATVSLDWNTIITAGIGLAGTALTTIIGYMVIKLREEAALSREEALRTREEAKDAKVAAKATSEEVSKVHAAVNSERTEALEEIRKLRDEILRLSTDKAVLATQAGLPQPEVKPLATPPAP